MHREDGIVPPKRDWWYIQRPSKFDVAPCSCGSHDNDWSEYKKYIWCAVCEKDFIPEHYGILDGPIPVHAAYMMGIRFDRFNAVSGEIEVFDVESCDFL